MSSPTPWRRFLLAGLDADDRGLPARVSRAIHAGWIVLRQVGRDRTAIRSGFLALWCIEALVPLLVLGAAVAGVIGQQDAYVAAVAALLDASIFGATSPQATDILSDLLDRASLPLLGVTGVLSSLFITAQLYLVVVYDYNDLLHTSMGRRNKLAATALFAFFILWVGVLLGGGVAASAALFTDTGFRWWLLPAPFLLTVLTMGVGLKIYPTAPTGYRAALIGGIVGATWFELVKTFFAFYTTSRTGLDSLDAVYHSIGFVSIFFFWMHLAWFSVLLSVEVAYVSEHGSALWAEHRDRVQSGDVLHRHADGWFAVGVLVALHQRSGDGGATSLRSLARAMSADPRAVYRALAVLDAEDLVEQPTALCFQPTRPPEQVQVCDVLSAWRRRVTSDARSGQGTSVETLAEQVEGGISQTIAELLDQPDGRGDDSADEADEQG